MSHSNESVVNTKRTSKYTNKLEGKYSLESTDPRESEIRAPRQLTIALKLSCYLLISQNYLRSRTVAWSLFTLEKSPIYYVFGQ